MSQRGRKRKVADSDEESLSEEEERPKSQRRRGNKEDDYNAKESGNSKSKTTKGHVSNEEKEKFVGEAMRLALFLDHQKLPLRRADINSKIVKDYKGHNLAGWVIAESQKRFKDIFGYELVELPRLKARASTTKKGEKKRAAKPKSSQTGRGRGRGSSSQASSSQSAAAKKKQAAAAAAKGPKAATAPTGGSGAFILRNLLPFDKRQHYDAPENAEQCGLLMVLLACLYLHEDKMDSDKLDASLRKLGIEEDVAHPVFGDVKKLMEQYCKQMYIHKDKTEAVSAKTQKVMYEYRMGARAMVEVEKSAILKFVAAVFGEELDSLLEKEAREEDQNEEEEEEEDGDEEDK